MRPGETVKTIYVYTNDTENKVIKITVKATVKDE
jgi:hypothetical protein